MTTDQHSNHDGVRSCDYSKEELQVLRKEIESLKALLLTFKKEDENKGKELAKAKQEINNLIKNHEEKLAELTKMFEAKKNELINQLNISQMKINRLQME